MGVGEARDALEVFHPDRLASRILGMGDVLTLIERAEEVLDEEVAERPGPRVAERVAEHVDLGYALTTYRAQSLTTDTAHLVLTPGATREALYVGMTRGRDNDYVIDYGGGAMMDIGFQNLSRLMASGKPLRVVVVDTQANSAGGGQSCTAGFKGQAPEAFDEGAGQRLKDEGRKELALIAMAHRGAFVMQSSQATPSHLFENLLKGLQKRRPALFILNYQDRLNAPLLVVGAITGAVRIPVVEMVEIGAGGGSLIAVDGLQRIQVGRIGLLVGVAGAHLQHMTDGDLCFPRIGDSIGRLRKEIEHLLIHARQAALLKCNPDQCRGVTLRHRLQPVLVINRALIEVVFGDEIAVLNN